MKRIITIFFLALPGVVFAAPTVPNAPKSIRCEDANGRSELVIQRKGQVYSAVLKEFVYDPVVFPGTLLGVLIDNNIDKDFVRSAKGQFIQIELDLETCQFSPTNAALFSCEQLTGTDLTIHDGLVKKVIHNSQARVRLMKVTQESFHGTEVFNDFDYVIYNQLHPFNGGGYHHSMKLDPVLCSVSAAD